MVIGEFCDTFPPNLDGVGRVTLAYCEGLKSLGNSVYYVGPHNPKAEDVDGLDTVLSASLKIPTELYRVAVPWVSLKYRKKLDEIPFDIVHAHSPFSVGLEAMRIARKRNIPLVATFHSKFYDDALKITHSKAISKTVANVVVDFFNKCDAVWSVNEGTAEVLRSYGFKGDIKVMENGTNVANPSDLALRVMREKLNYIDGIPTLLFVGQHNTKKNLDGVIRACAILKQKGLKLRLVTAGDGPDFDKLMKLARELDLENEVQFLGFVANFDELMALYTIADLLVFPSIYDNAPMVLREAATAGTAGLLVANSTAAENFRDGVNAFIAQDETPKAIAKKIVEALPVADKVGAEAQKTIPIAWSVIMEKVMREYKKLIEEKRSHVENIS